MMNEARLILPAAGNEGQDLDALHGDFQAKLCESFGGFTAVNAHGGWKAPDGQVITERVVVYDVACDRSELRNNLLLRQIAAWLCFEAAQQVIYLRLPSGSVEFVTVQERIAA